MNSVITFKCPKEIRDYIAKLSEAENRSMSKQIITIIEHYRKTQGKQNGKK